MRLDLFLITCEIALHSKYPQFLYHILYNSEIYGSITYELR